MAAASDPKVAPTTFVGSMIYHNMEEPCISFIADPLPTDGIIILLFNGEEDKRIRKKMHRSNNSFTLVHSELEN